MSRRNRSNRAFLRRVEPGYGPSVSLGFAGALAAILVFAPVKAGAFHSTGAMGTPRYEHTATLLANGKVLVAGGYSGTNDIASTELYDPATGTWEATGPLNTSRDSHTATLLPNGKVLVAGGGTFSSTGSWQSISSAELYDPVTGTWTATAPMRSPRYGHTATLLANGTVLIAGGDDDWTTLDSAELYDPGAGAWIAAGVMANSHAFHTATLLPGGQVLVAGGAGTAGGSSSELYDPATRSWSATGELADSRASHTAALLPDGKVLVAGGGWYGFFFGSTPTAELYDPATGTWKETGSMVTSDSSVINGRFSHTATLLTNGLVLITGGQETFGILNSSELYYPSTGTWAAAGGMTTARELHTATLLPNGQVLLAGGLSGSVAGSKPVSSAELYDPVTIGTWKDAGALSTARNYHTATLLTNGQVLVAGGNGYTGGNLVALEKSELFNPASGTWAQTGSMNSRRMAHTATLLSNGQVLVAGGDDNGSQWSAELYDPTTASWSETGSLNEARTWHTATLLPNGKVLIAGGSFTPGTLLASAELYDPTSGTWTFTGSMAAGRANHTATLLPTGKVLVVGGAFQDTNYQSSAELYDPRTGVWTLTASFASEPGQHTATLLPNGKVLVAGGGTQFVHSMATVRLYDPVTETWAPAAPMAFDRSRQTATLLPNGMVLVAGGLYGAFFNSLPNAEVYDPAADSWATAASLKFPRGGHTATLLTSGLVLLAGGAAGNSLLSSAELFDFGTTAPRAAPVLTAARRLADGSFQFSFTNSPAVTFTVLAHTNPMLPLSNWSVLGTVDEISPGRFEFTDIQATNYSARFYRLRSP